MLAARRILDVSCDAALPEGEDTLLEPLSPYAITKVAGELYMQSYHRLYGLETVSLRYFNIYGPLQDYNSKHSTVIPLFIKTIMEDRQPVIFGDGTASRDFTYVKDVANANLLAFDAGGAAGKTFNIACGNTISINEMVEKINHALGKSIKPLHKEERKGDVLHTRADISRAKKVLGYEPKYDFETGLRETIKWFRSGKI